MKEEIEILCTYEKSYETVGPSTKVVFRAIPPKQGYYTWDLDDLPVSLDWLERNKGKTLRLYASVGVVHSISK